MMRRVLPIASKFHAVRSVRPVLGSIRGIADNFGERDLDTTTHVHFRASSRPHPLNAKPKDIRSPLDEALGDHSGRQQNHIWTSEELEEKMSTLYRHKPKTVTDHVMNNLMYGLYHTFNFMTGYTPVDPSVKAIEWRLILLESIAGVPGFVAAGFRHFRSLRRLQRDHGWIATLLEEAENERMHLLLCLSTFKAGYVTRTLVVAAQYVMTPFLMGVYLVQPKAMHRFVGYLEETACHTYVNTIRHIETPGTKLNKAWGTLPAPALAVGYYHLPKDALWVDTLKCMMADEANHRDVNHTFADMKSDDPNPFVEKHKENAAMAWRLNTTGETAFTAEEIRNTRAPPAAPSSH
jgi:hypothetical protein